MTTLQCSLCDKPYPSEFSIPDDLVADMISLCPSCERSMQLQGERPLDAIYDVLKAQLDATPAKGIEIPIPDEMMERIRGGETIWLQYNADAGGFKEISDPEENLQ